jgi:tape measure domain-containing protein
VADTTPDILLSVGVDDGPFRRQIAELQRGFTLNVAVGGTGNATRLGTATAASMRQAEQAARAAETSVARYETAVARAARLTENLNAAARRAGAPPEIITRSTAAAQQYARALEQAQGSAVATARANIALADSLALGRRDVAAHNAAVGNSFAGIRRAVESLTAASLIVPGPLGRIGVGLSAVTRLASSGTLALAATAGGFLALAGGALLAAKAGADTLLVYQRIENALTAATGSQQAAREEYGRVLEITRRLGGDLEANATGYAKLAAAARGTRLEGAATRDIFEAITTASVALGLSQEKTQLSLLAVEQITSKGVVSMEELRRQLGDALPGAFRLAAAAVGVTTAQLDRMIREGRVMAEDFLPKFAAEIQRAYGPAAQQAAGGLQTAINRLKTELFELGRVIGEAESNPITQFFNGLARALRDIRGATTLEDLKRDLRELQAQAAGANAAIIGSDGGQRAERERQLRERIAAMEANARARAAIDAALAHERGVGEALGPGPDLGPFRERLATIEREAERARRDLPVAERLAAAMAEAAERAAQFRRAQAQFLSFRDPGSPAAVDASERAERLLKQLRSDEARVRDLQREQRNALAEFAEAGLRIRAELEEAIGDPREAFILKGAADLGAEFRKISDDEAASVEEKNRRIQELTARHLQRLRQFDLQREREVAEALTREVHLVRDATETELETQTRGFRELLNRMDALSRIGLEDVPAGTGAPRDIGGAINKALGIEKTETEVRGLLATIGLFGQEATEAALRSSTAFQALRAALEQSGDTEGLAALEAAIKRLAQLTEGARFLKFVMETQQAERALKAEGEAFDRVGADAEKHRLAIVQTGKSYAELSAALEGTSDRAWKQIIDRMAEATARQKTLQRELSLTTLGFRDQASAIIAANDAVTQQITKLETAAKELEDSATADQRLREAQLRFRAAQHQFAGDTAGFFLTTFQRTLEAGTDLWASLTRLAQDGARSMQQALSDLFFDPVNLNFQSLVGSFRRALADFLASSVLRQFLAVANSIGSGVANAAASGATGGIGAGVSAGSAGATAIAGLGTSVLALAGQTGLGPAVGGRVGQQISAFGGGGNVLLNAPALIGLVRAALEGSPLVVSLLQNGGLASLAGGAGGILGLVGGLTGNANLARGGSALASLGLLSEGSGSAVASLLGISSTAATGLLAGIGAAINIGTGIHALLEGNTAVGAGSLGGTAVGAAIGTLIEPGIGTLIGAAIGGSLGSFLGGLFGGGSSGAQRRRARQDERATAAIQALFEDLSNVKSPLGVLAALRQQRDEISIAAGGAPLESVADVRRLLGEPGSAQILQPRGTGRPAAGAIGPLQDVLGQLGKALEQAEQQIARVLNDLLELTVTPPKGTLKEQLLVEAQQFRATLDTINAENQRLVDQLRASLDPQTTQEAIQKQLAILRTGTTEEIERAREELANIEDPAKILQRVAEVREAIEKRYTTEVELVRRFAGVLDELAKAWASLGDEVEAQIATLQATGPFDPFILAQAQLARARERFQEEQTPEAGQAVARAVDEFVQAGKALVDEFERAADAWRSVERDALDFLREQGAVTPGAQVQLAQIRLIEAVDRFFHANNPATAQDVIRQASQLVATANRAMQDLERAMDAWLDLGLSIQAQIAQLGELQSGDLLGLARSRMIAAFDELLSATQPKAEDAQRVTSLIGEFVRTAKDVFADFERSIKAWQDVAERIDEQVFNLKVSQFGSTNPSVQFDLAQQRFDALVAQFRETPTPELAGRVSGLGETLLRTASEVFTRPSPEYRSLFDHVVSVLESVGVEAKSQEEILNDRLVAAIGEGVTIQRITADAIERLEQVQTLAVEQQRSLQDQIVEVFGDQATADELIAFAIDRVRDVQEVARVQQEVLLSQLIDAVGQDLATAIQEGNGLQAIANLAIEALQDVQTAAEEQEEAFRAALLIALGDAKSVDELVERNTKAVADQIGELRKDSVALFEVLGFDLSRLADRTTAPLGQLVSLEELNLALQSSIAASTAATAANTSGLARNLAFHGVTGPIHGVTEPIHGVTPGFPISVDAAGFQHGGWVPGTGHGDIVPMRGEPGEFMIRKGVARLWPRELEQLNRTGQFSPGAGGGVNVGPIYVEVSGNGLSPDELRRTLAGAIEDGVERAIRWGPARQMIREIRR